MKKLVSYISILSVISIAVILLLALFKIIGLKGLYVKILLTATTTLVASLISSTSIILVEKKNKIAYISLSLLIISSILVLITVWVKIESNTFAKIVWSLSTISVLFNLIVGYYFRLGKKSYSLQIFTYLLFSLVGLLILLLINVKGFTNTVIPLYLLAVLLILSLVFAVILKTQMKKDGPDLLVNDEYVTIKKSEYLEMIEKIKKYEGN